MSERGVLIRSDVEVSFQFDYTGFHSVVTIALDDASVVLHVCYLFFKKSYFIVQLFLVETFLSLFLKYTMVE